MAWGEPNNRHKSVWETDDWQQTVATREELIEAIHRLREEKITGIRGGIEAVDAALSGDVENARTWQRLARRAILDGEGEKWPQ